MSYEIEIIRKAKVLVTEWSGGKTAELVIYPNTAEYRKRNFQFRISTAVIEQDPSAFTILPGFERVLMMLEGTIRIEHQGHRAALLEPFQPYSFSGDRITKSYGTGRDFNLMLSETCSGNLATLIIESRKEIIFRQKFSDQGLHFIHFYAYDATIQFHLSDRMIRLEPGDSIMISGNGIEDFRIENPADTLSHLIVSEINVRK